MKTQPILFATVGVLVVAAAIGCGKDNRSNADRVADSSPAASQPAPTVNDWTVDRDTYVSRRQQDLDELQQRWELAKDKADRKSKRAWKEMEEQTVALRHDLDEAKNATKETWDGTRQKLDESWHRIENKTRDVFSGNETHGS
ncbi:MAG TPA: hypothetical protein VG096_12900 [Bryobacteraceae bacterium]|nr:hypothetical protein [Bryobacteraceae bacterium]